MRCGRCGALLDAGGNSQGLCPACLLHAAVAGAAADSMFDAEAVADTPSDVAPADASVPYRILTVLGEGAHGVTFLGQERSARGGLVALRILDAGARPAVDRFEAARTTLARLHHPSISRLLDVGLSWSGRVYVATDFVPGTPLALALKRIREGDEKRGLARSLTQSLARTLARQLCEAVQTAHACGVLHLALRPSKIRVASVEGVPRLKVLDFGLATLVDGVDGSAADDFAGISALLGTMDPGLPRGAAGTLQELIDALAAETVNTRQDRQSRASTRSRDRTIG